MTLTFVAYGQPQPKGSSRAFVPKGWKRPIITSANPKAKGWQQLVAEAASAAIRRVRTFQLLDGPVLISATFYMPRPKSIRDKSVPHLKKPDTDKLLRSTVDALSKVVWRDDSQVVEMRAKKFYARPGESPRAEVTVTQLQPEQLEFV